MFYTKYETSGTCSFKQEDFWKPILDPVTYWCNQLERFEKIWQGTTQALFLWSLVKLQWGVSETKMFFFVQYQLRTRTSTYISISNQ